MPELPDITVYVEALAARIAGETLERIRLTSPFLLRSVEPPVEDAEGRAVRGVSRLGKRIVIDLAGDLHLVLHLMIAGRLQWKKRGAKPRRRIGLAAFEFSSGTLLFTEAGKKRRASLHLVRGEDGLAPFDRGGLEIFAADPQEFARTLRRENHTLKRALTDPRLVSGIGNAYSDEILHRARLSPLRLTRKLRDEEIERLFAATVSTLEEWVARLREEACGDFPKKVTAFHPQMAVHGRHREPCPACGAPVQRIVYAENETHYCPGCQTDGRILADRALSRLLKKDWPRSVDEL